MRLLAMQTEGWLLTEPGIGMRTLTLSSVRVAPSTKRKRVTPLPYPFTAWASVQIHTVPSAAFWTPMLTPCPKRGSRMWPSRLPS